MKFSLIRSVVGLVSLSSVALAQLNCETLKEEKVYVDECLENGNGEISTLAVYLRDEIDSEISEKIRSIKSLKNLKFGYKDVIENVNISFEELTNLEELYIDIQEYETFGYRDYHSLVITRSTLAENGLKLPKNLKKLSIEGVELNQNAIDEIAKISNLESLKLQYVDTINTNFEAFANNKNLSSLSIVESVSHEYVGRFNSNILSNFKSVKDLELDEVTLNEDVINSISKLNIEKLTLRGTVQNNEDYSALGNLENLTSLEILNPYSLGEEEVEDAVKVRIEYDEDILNSLSHLKKLTLHDFKISEKFAKSINNLNELEELDINNLSNEEKLNVEEISKLPKLNVFVYDNKNVKLNKVPARTVTVTITRAKIVPTNSIFEVDDEPTATVDIEPTTIAEVDEPTVAVENEAKPTTTVAFNEPTAAVEREAQPTATVANNEPVVAFKNEVKPTKVIKHRKCIVRKSN